MALKLNIERHLDVTVMELSGRVTLGEGAILFRDAILDALWNGHRKLALDYGDVNYQDSTGLGEMFRGYTIVSNSGGEMVIFSLTKKVHDLLQITKLYTVFDVYDSRENALAHFDRTRRQETTVNVMRFPEVALFNIGGALTAQSGAQKVREAVEKAMDSGIALAILLCPQVLEIDDSGAETLIETIEAAKEFGNDIVLAGVEERLMPGLAAVGLADKIRSHATLNEALDAFGFTVNRKGTRYEVVRAAH